MEKSKHITGADVISKTTSNCCYQIIENGVQANEPENYWPI